MNIGSELKKLNILIARKVMSQSKNKGCTLSHVQVKILKYLYENEKVYQKDLEKQFDIRRSTVSGILKTMEKNDLIKRIDSKEDARVKEIVITGYAKEKVEKVEEYINLFENTMIKDISKKDLEIFYEVIHKIQSNVEGMD